MRYQFSQIHLLPKRAVVAIIDYCLKVKEELRLKYIVCVFNQAINCKAMELKWQYPDMHSDCVKIVESFI